MAHIGVHVRSAPPSLRFTWFYFNTRLPGVVHYPLSTRHYLSGFVRHQFHTFFVTAPAVLFLGTPGLYPPDTRNLYFISLVRFPCTNLRFTGFLVSFFLGYGSHELE